jgi:hypothetical protein
LSFKSIVLAGFFLAIISIMAIHFGENLLFYLGPFNTVSIQSPLALIIAMLIFFFYMYVLHRIEFFDLKIYSLDDSLLIFAVSVAWSPILYLLLHYYTNGVWVNWKAIFSILFWQIPTNLLIVFMFNCAAQRWKK